MKRLTMILGVIFLILNLIAGFIISTYDAFNVAFNCGVIAITVGIIYTLFIISLRDAFRISLSILFASMGGIELILGFIMPQQIQDNWYLLVEIIFLCLEILMIIISIFISNKIK